MMPNDGIMTMLDAFTERNMQQWRGRNNLSILRTSEPLRMI